MGHLILVHVTSYIEAKSGEGAKDGGAGTEGGGREEDDG